MALTTPDRVLSIAPQLGGLTPAQLDLFIEDAEQDVLKLPADKIVGYEERLTRYLTAHLASMAVRQTKSEEVTGELKVTFDSDSASDYWGEYAKLLISLGIQPETDAPSMGLLVV